MWSLAGLLVSLTNQMKVAKTPLKPETDQDQQITFDWSKMFSLFPVETAVVLN